MKDEYYPTVPINDTVKSIESHKLFMENQIVCLQEDWWKAFDFIAEVLGVFFNKEDSGVKYECDNPFVKIKLSEKTERTTKRVEMKQHKYGVEKKNR